jgi:hypothetical protein
MRTVQVIRQNFNAFKLPEILKRIYSVDGNDFHADQLGWVDAAEPARRAGA